jgi:hypothetical protein
MLEFLFWNNQQQIGKNMYRFILLISVAALISGCGNDINLESNNQDSSNNNLGSSNNDISIENDSLKMNLSLNSGGSSTKITNYLDSSTATAIRRVEATVRVDESSTVAPGASIETDIRIEYQPENNRNEGSKNKYFVVLRLRNNGNGPFVQSFMGMCLDSRCTKEIYIEPDSDGSSGQMIKGTPINNWSLASDISIEFVKENKFILSYNGQTIDIPVTKFNNHTRVIRTGVTISASDFIKVRLRTRIKNIDIDGESGKITVFYDNVKISELSGGEIEDDFSSNEIDKSKWKFGKY